jgi:hypothetical protein
MFVQWPDWTFFGGDGTSTPEIDVKVPNQSFFGRGVSGSIEPIPALMMALLARGKSSA